MDSDSKRPCRKCQGRPSLSDRQDKYNKNQHDLVDIKEYVILPVFPVVRFR